LKHFKQNNFEKPKKKKKKVKQIKSKTGSYLLMESKEELEGKISKLKQDYDILSQKTQAQLEEEFYQYLEIDDNELFRKKMVGYLLPFRSRFPLRVVTIPAKRDLKQQKEMHKILVQRHEELIKEKEMKQNREKEILFEKRKKRFETENDKLKQKISQKNDYIQIKKNEEDFQKERAIKLTWDQIQNQDYDAFILNQGKKNKNFDEIFTTESNQFDGDDGDYLKKFRNLTDLKKKNSIKK